MMENSMLKKEVFTFNSSVDGLTIETEIIAPNDNPCGIVQFSHGMAEHKERYEDFMTFLAKNGFVTIIHDHRGHGQSIRSKEDLGYFYTTNTQAIVEDLHNVIKIIKNKYPSLPLYLFSHSMGTLVARKYLKKYDNELSRLILCGAPTKNSAVNFAIMLAKISSKIHGDKYRNKLLNQLAFGSANKKFGQINAWLSSDLAEVDKYQHDPLCGYTFTNNGFLNLFSMMKEAFDERDWQPANRDLPILLIAGSDDPIIQSEKMFAQLEAFLNKVGYHNTSSKLYENMRHELLNEKNKHTVYNDVLNFLVQDFSG